MRLSVVIPVHEDRTELAKGWEPLAEADEVVVVDSSRHDPVRSGDLPAMARLIHSPVANRAVQQNLGAAAATGEAILFLHADTRLGDGGLAAVRAVLQDPEVVGGGFVRHFDSPSRFLHWSCRLAAGRGRHLGWFLGDQGIFVRRGPFHALGGFRILRYFEDYDLCRRLKRCGKLRCLEPPVVSSARRFAGLGPVRRSLRDFALTAGYVMLGTRPFRVRGPGGIKLESSPPDS